MSTRRTFTVTAAVAASAAAALAGAGLAAAKSIAVADRRRSGITRRQAEVAAALSDPSDATQRTLVMRDGTLVHVVERGPADGVPLVLLHGVTLSTRLWHRTLDALGDRYRVVALDWRGHGSSTVGSLGYGLGPLAGDLAEVLVRLDLTGAVVVGHSMGGMALMRFCGDHPVVLRERVAGLVFLSTACAEILGGSLPSVLRGAVGRLAHRPWMASRASWIAPGDLGYAMVRATFGERPSPLWVEQVRHIVEGMDPQATAQSVIGLLDHDARSVLPGVDTPSLVVVGTRDLLTPPAQARVTASLLPDAELVVLDGGGHLLMLERQDELHRLLTQLAERVAADR